MAAITTVHTVVAPSGEWVTEANGRLRGEGRGLPPSSMSAASCKAGVYARCPLKTVGTGDKRPLLELRV